MSTENEKRGERVQQLTAGIFAAAMEQAEPDDARIALCVSFVCAAKVCGMDLEEARTEVSALWGMAGVVAEEDSGEMDLDGEMEIVASAVEGIEPGDTITTRQVIAQVEKNNKEPSLH